MSITTSRDEREQAQAKVVQETDEQLRADLAFWAVAVADHEDTFTRLTNERQTSVDLFQEAQAWIRLVTTELQQRRRSSRQ